LGNESPALATTTAGRLAKFTFVGAVEGGFLFVAYIGGDLCDAARSTLERARSELETPASEIGHKGLEHKARESLDQG
jgi:hypothetical protein